MQVQFLLGFLKGYEGSTGQPGCQQIELPQPGKEHPVLQP
jgi:hypothetical protein